MSARTAIIWGITGQDGSYLAELLLSKGYRVVGVSRRTSLPNDGRVRHLYGNDNFSVVQGDVTDPFFVGRTVSRELPVAQDRDGARLEVYNLAAQSFVKTSFDEPAHTTHVDYLGALNCLEAVRHAPAPRGNVRFYQASSSEMFGRSYSMVREYDQWDVVQHFDYEKDRPEHVWAIGYCGKTLEAVRMNQAAGRQFPRPYQDELTPFAPCSPYAIAKLAAHHLCRVYRDAYGVFACSGILFNHESPRRGEEFVTRKITRYVAALSKWKAKVGSEESGGITFDYGSITPWHVSAVRLNKNKEPYGHKDSWLFGPKFPFLKLGNLDAKRDWGHAEDYARGMWLMLQQEKPDDYVLATGEAHSVRDFLKAAFAAVGHDGDLPVEVDPALFRPCEVPLLRGDAGKARKQLGWSPQVSFDQLVRRMVYADLEAG